MIKNRSNKLFGRSGFTLVELSVSVAIIGLLSGLFLANYRAAERQQRLFAAADQLVSDIRLSQSYALGAKKQDGQVPLGGWGVHLATASSTSYQMYADTCASGIGTFESSCATGTPDVVVKSANLPKDVRIAAGNGLVVDGSSVDDVSLLFLPPDPKTSINSTGQNLKINLSDMVTGQVKEIDVNFFGLIDIR